MLFRVLFELLVMVRAQFIWINGRMLRHAVWVLVQVLFWGMQGTVRAHFCKIDGRVLGGMQSGVLVQVVF